MHNFFHIRIRHAFKNRMYFFSNLIGLVLGFSACYLIGTYILDELHYDKFHENYEELYRVIQYGDYEGIVERSSSCPFPLGPTLKEDNDTLIQEFTRLYNNRMPTTLLRYKNVSINDSGFYYADSGFFDVFSVHVLRGDEKKLLTKPFTAVITASTAKRFFGYENAVGRKLTVEDNYQVEVVAVVKDWPQYSHFHFSVLTSMETFRMLIGGKLSTNWINNPCWTYIRLKDAKYAPVLEKRLDQFVKSRFSPNIRENNSLYLQPVSDIHLNSNLEYEIQQNGNIAYLYIFGGIAFFLILMAGINYVNLTTGSFSKRALEIAIKKLEGANKVHIRLQLIVEAFVITFIGSVVALALAEMLLPWFNNLTGKNFHFTDLLTLESVLYILILNVVLACASGLYPSFFIAGLKPSNILRGNFSRGSKSATSRKILVFSQLFVSGMLLMAAFTIKDQYNHLVSGNNGVDKENIIIINARYTELQKKFNQLKSVLSGDKSVVAITSSDYIPGIDHNRHAFHLKPKNKHRILGFFPVLNVTDDFFNVYKVSILHGRNFNSDTAEYKNSVLINAEMSDYLGYSDLTEVLGVPLSSYRGKEKVIGVFKDFYPKTLRYSPDPFIIDLVNPKSHYGLGREYISIRYKENDQLRFQVVLKAALKSLMGDKQLKVQTYKSIYQSQFEEEYLYSRMSGIIAVLSLIISFIGLWGLISFMIDQKSKELSIRKVYGASVWSLMNDILNEFFRLYGMVLFILFPVSWYLSNLWLSGFASHIAFSIVNYLYTAIILAVLVVSVTTVRVYKAANINPSKALKYQ